MFDALDNVKTHNNSIYPVIGSLKQFHFASLFGHVINKSKGAPFSVAADFAGLNLGFHLSPTTKSGAAGYSSSSAFSSISIKTNLKPSVLASVPIKQ